MCKYRFAVYMIVCQECEALRANAIYSVIWIDNTDVENSSVYLCMECADKRFGP